MFIEINTSYEIKFRTGDERYEILYTLDRRVLEKEVGKGEGDKDDWLTIRPSALHHQQRLPP